jgi:hypothetical protein
MLVIYEGEVTSMSRLQKRTWNPALVALQPSHISLTIWIILSPFIYVGLQEGNYGFLLGFAIGLSFMQAGYAWGQYREHWWRFFMQNRTAIFNSKSCNHPTKKIAWTYVLAVFAKSSFAPVGLFVALIAMYALDILDASRTILFPLDLLIACVMGAITSAVLTNRLSKWGEAKATQLTDFSYVFESEPEQQSD